MDYRKMPKDKVAKLMHEGRLHLEFMTKIYRMQVVGGRYFVHEHPATAVSWSEKSITGIAMLPGVEVVTADQCQYGLRTKAQEGGTAPANVAAAAKAARKRCFSYMDHFGLNSLFLTVTPDDQRDFRIRLYIDPGRNVSTNYEIFSNFQKNSKFIHLNIVLIHCTTRSLKPIVAKKIILLVLWCMRNNALLTLEHVL